MKTLQDWWHEARDALAPLPCLMIDCAGLEGGRDALPMEAFSEAECLFTGDLADELGDVGGWLARVKSWDDTVMAVVAHLMQQQLAVLLELPPLPEDDSGRPAAADSGPSFAQLHRHLRKFNVVYGPEGQPLFWRYYDPRVLPSVLGVLDERQRKGFVGPFARVWVMGVGDGDASVLEAVGSNGDRLTAGQR